MGKERDERLLAKYYIRTGSLRETVLVEEGSSPRFAALAAIERALEFDKEIEVGTFVYVNQFGFGDDEIDDNAMMFLFDELFQLV